MISDSADEIPKGILVNQDKILRCTGERVELRFVLVDATKTMNLIGAQHEARGAALKLLGEAGVSSLLLAAGLKFPGVLQAIFHFSGVVTKVEADATPLGYIRAMIPRSQLKSLKGSEHNLFLGPGQLAVSKINQEGKKVMESVVDMPDTKIGRILTTYQWQSEQINSAVGVFSQIGNKDNELDFCGGFLVETFPKADNATIEVMENNIRSLPDFKLFHITDTQGKGGLDLLALLSALSHPFSVQIHKEIEVSHLCSCSIANVERSVVGLGIETLQEIITEGKETEVFCDYCRKRYELSVADISRIYKSLKGS